jgi:hypothetical protein
VAVDQHQYAGQQQQQQQSLTAVHGGMPRPSTRVHGGHQYTTLEDTLAYIRRHRAGSTGARR